MPNGASSLNRRNTRAPAPAKNRARRSQAAGRNGTYRGSRDAKEDAMMPGLNDLKETKRIGSQNKRRIDEKTNRPDVSKRQSKRKHSEQPRKNGKFVKIIASRCGRSADRSEASRKESLNDHSDHAADAPSCSSHSVASRMTENQSQPQQQVEPWIRRKFYIVENGGRPSEVYCTDFVHKAKNKYGKSKALDESRLMKVLDRWREEWNRGVQMPLSKQRQSYIFERIDDLTEKKTCLIPDYPPPESMFFELPKKYVAVNEKRYVSELLLKFEKKALTSLYNYEMDRVDEEWLSDYSSSSHQTIHRRTFLDIVNEFEVESYKKIHNALLESLLAKDQMDGKSEEDADCDICRMPESECDDEIVFCDGCNISVHQSCYGLQSVPTEEWLCRVCSLCEYRAPPCIFCPIRGGAMTFTKTKEAWAHVLCSLWIPEVRFGDVDQREPVTHVSEIPAEKWQLKCSICDTTNGVCIACTSAGCGVPFHVACAQRAGLVLRIEHNTKEKIGVSMVSLCARHSASSPYRNPKSRSSPPAGNESNRLSEMTQNFLKFVECQSASQKFQVPAAVTNAIFKYWQWKRIRNNCQPLIREPVDIKLVSPPLVRKTKTPFRNRQRHNLSAPSPEVLKEYERIRTLRQNLEKARNLCYMISKREKLKRLEVANAEETSINIGSLLIEGSGLTPLSNRRTDKLLEIWKLGLKGVSPLEANDRDTQSPVQESKPAVVLPTPIVIGSNNSSNGKKMRKSVDHYKFRGSNSPTPSSLSSEGDEDDDGHSSISTLTEYSLAGISSGGLSNDSSTLYDFENDVYAPSPKSRSAPSPFFVRIASTGRHHPTVVIPRNIRRKAAEFYQPTIDVYDIGNIMNGGRNPPKRMCLRNKGI